MTQEEFWQTFITTRQIAEHMGLTYQAIQAARKNGYLPGEIAIAPDSPVVVWNREQLEPVLENWKKFGGCANRIENKKSN